MSRNPRTPAEWQEAVDAAQACLLLDAARQYGLVEGGPGVNVDRCLGILDHGRARGFVPNDQAVDQCLEAMGREL